MSDDLLSAIMAAAATAARERARRHGPDVERAAAGRRPDGARFVSALQAEGLQVIAECKRRSPSRGILRDPYDPAAIATEYATHGAAAISVLTEPAFFDGALSHLEVVRAAVDLPVLRKDFLSEAFQIVEAKALGADAVLLIVAGLDDVTLRRLIRRAVDEGLAALVEVHDRNELARALAAGATLVGVNCRNLRTLEVDRSVHDDVIAEVPGGITVVAESGIRTGADLVRLRAAGYHACLIGERFMAAGSPGDALATLLREAE